MDGHLPRESSRKLVLLTGARQTGKTTLLKSKYGNLKYVNLDAPENRDYVRSISSFLWGETMNEAVIDEAQKEPTVFEKTKFAYDAGELDFTVLSGSSQILLLKQIRETLAGRIILFEMMPLMLSEISGRIDKDKILFQRLICAQTFAEVFNNEPSVILPQADALLKTDEDYVLGFGGMPALLSLNDDERWKWLKDYEYTYLERDLADLARLTDLEPFRKFQKLCALRSGCLINYSDLARDCGVSPDTAKRYLEYLKLSYQVILLQPYSENLTSSIVKSPKLYFQDVGILRSLSGKKEGLSGEIYETMVITEMWKWIKTFGLDNELTFYRTRSGMEVDGILKTDTGIIGIEIKSREELFAKDVTPLKEVAEKLGNRFKGGLVIYRGNKLYKIAEPNIYAVPSRRLF